MSLDAARLRADFPILSTKVHGDRPLVYLDNAATTQRPRQVLEAVTQMYERYYSNVHRGIHWLSDQSSEMYEQARSKVRAFINARSDREIVFTAGTTASINLVARSWGEANLRAGDEVLLSVMEHHSNLVPWYQLAERTGCTVQHVPITDDGLLRLDQFDRLLTERTKLVAVCAVSNVLGTINPVEEIVRRAHAAGALALIDAAQSVPHDATDVQATGADFFAFSGHKMLGPSGIGVLYGKEELLEQMPPFLGGGSMIRTVELGGFTPGILPAKFEAGTPPIVPAVALGAAIDYLQQVGLTNIHAYEQQLARRAHQVLADVGDVRFLGPSPDEKAGIVSFVVEEIHANDLAEFFDRHGVAIRAGHHCTMPLHKQLGISASARASFYFYNTPADVDRLGEALTKTKNIFHRR